jgi:hypothetical protein
MCSASFYVCRQAISYYGPGEGLCIKGLFPMHSVGQQPQLSINKDLHYSYRLDEVKLSGGNYLISIENASTG